MFFASRSVASLLSLVFLLASTAPASADPATQGIKLLRNRAADERPKLMLLGAPHFANYGQDVLNNQVPDVLEPQRQKEMAAVVDALVKFNPTKVVVEWTIDSQAALDKRYDDFRSGTYVLSRSETDQLGLRVAARLGHTRIYAVDWNEMPPGDEASYDWVQWAESHGQQARLDMMRDKTSTKQIDSLMRNATVGEWLVHFNRPQELERSNRRYFDYVMLSDAVNYPGANWVGNWYARNLKIFANLVRLADKQDDRVLVIYGQGHIFPLRQFAEQSGAFTLVAPLPVLQAKR